MKTVQFSLVSQSCPTLCDPTDCSMPGFPVHHQLPEFTQTHIHWVGDAIEPSILCHSLLLLPSIFPSIRVFPNESVLCITWPKYWSFSFSISPSNEYSGLTSFRIDWFDVAVQGTLKSSPTPQFKGINSSALSFLYSPAFTSTTGYCFCFGSVSSFFLQLFLHWSPVAYWAPTNLGHSSFSVLSFCLFILFMGF